MWTETILATHHQKNFHSYLAFSILLHWVLSTYTYKMRNQAIWSKPSKAHRAQPNKIPLHPHQRPFSTRSSESTLTSEAALSHNGMWKRKMHQLWPPNYFRENHHSGGFFSLFFFFLAWKPETNKYKVKIFDTLGIPKSYPEIRQHPATKAYPTVHRCCSREQTPWAKHAIPKTKRELKSTLWNHKIINAIEVPLGWGSW